MNLRKSLLFRQEDGQKPVEWDSNPSTVELQGSQTISKNFPEVLGSSSPIATSMQGNQAGTESWEEFIGIDSELLQPTTKCDGKDSCTLQQTSSNAFSIPYQSSYNLDSPRRKRTLGASDTTNCSETAPHTPDQRKRLKSPQLSVVHEFSVDGSLTHEKDAQEITSTDGKEVQIHSPTRKRTLNCSEIAPHAPDQRKRLKSHQLSMVHEFSVDGSRNHEKDTQEITSTHGKEVQMHSPTRKRTLGASHTTNCSEIAPHAPDQRKRLKSHQLSVVHEFSVDGSLNHEKDTQEITSTDGKEVQIHSDQLLECVIASPSPSNSRSQKDKNICVDGGDGEIDLITFADGKDVQLHSDQLLQSVVASPSPSNSTSLKDKNVSEDGDHEGIDLNKSPQLKTRKRKKHRPKVVVEGKSKRTPKPMPLKTQNSTSSGKRKYVRKKGLKDSTSQGGNEKKPVGAPSAQSAVKSCRRVLNFGKEAEVRDLGTISSMGLNRISTIPVAKEEQQKRYSAETHQSGSICDQLNSTNQTSPDKCLPLSATAPPTATSDHTLNVIARSINLKNAMAYQSQNQLGYSKEHQQVHGEATNQMPLHPNTASAKLDALNPADAPIPPPKLKNVNRLRSEHQVYEIPDSHPLLEGMDRREPDDPSPYLLAIWTQGETANSTQPPECKCTFQGTGKLCNDKTCFSCSNVRGANSQIVRGTILIPCRTATRGSFAPNGTDFQVNEVLADHESSVSPINVPRDWLWPLARRTVFFGTSVSAIFRGLSTTGIQHCSSEGFVCVRGFDRKAQCPRPLLARLHHGQIAPSCK